MKIREISFFRDFCCNAGKCEETCCRGWIIPLEKEDAERMKNAGGLLGLRLFFATSGHLRDQFNSSSAVCPFLNRDGLCSMQLAKGHDFLPEACRSFPRFYRNYGAFEERLIDLSCIEGAALWFSRFKELDFHETEGEPESGRFGSNEDEDYLLTLVACRQEMTDALLAVETVADLRDVLARIDAYASEAQQAFLKENGAWLAENPFVTYRPDELCKPESNLFPFDANVYEEIMHTHLYGERLSLGNPTLYGYCQLFFRKLNAAKPFRRHWAELADDLLAKYPQYVPYYAGLYAYYLLQHFLKTFDDYSFRRNVRMGLIHLNMKFLFDVLLWEQKGDFDDKDFIKTVAVYNRRAYFNEQIMDEMYRTVEKMCCKD
ncbi:MAG: flagellin lysine-N-methylase [Lachnospiraceae bacterium]|nr:flagellin lysine-N-methylase [Lachnospiraceae bacterium]